MSDTNPIILSVINSIAHLVLNNPPKNEMTSHFFNELATVCSTNLPSLSVNGLILHGIGRHFSSGAHVPQLISLFQHAERPAPFLAKNIESFTTIENLPYPTVAAINGCCLGSGLELALTCAYRIATPHAVFSFPEATFDIMPGCGGTVRLPGLVSRAKAIELILTGAMVPAEEALSIGLIDAIVEKEQLIGSAEKLIRNL